MTDATVALARALEGEHCAVEHLESILANLAALGYEVKPIEQAAEAADREAAGRDEAPRKPTSAAADLDALARDSLPLLRWVLPAGYVFDGVRRLYEDGRPTDRWEIRAVLPITTCPMCAAHPHHATATATRTEPIEQAAEATPSIAPSAAADPGACYEDNCPWPHYHSAAADLDVEVLARAMLASGIRCEPEYPTTLDAARALAAAYAAALRGEG